MAYTRKATATRARILEIAASLIMEKGYSEMRLDQVLSQARVQKGNFYYYFESKADMSHAAAKEVIIPKAYAWLDSLLRNTRQGAGLEGFFSAMSETVADSLALITCPIALFVDLGNEHQSMAETYQGFMETLAEKLTRPLAVSGSTIGAAAFANLLTGSLIEYKATRDAGRLVRVLSEAAGSPNANNQTT